ncbi:hypothetical protein MMC25_008282 [Agyrium rufum]|nr:hypothetical protein [Agyrium rufum]
MEAETLSSLIEDLEDSLDDLEEKLDLLGGSTGEKAAKLPLLDRAKVFVLATYAIESLIFSFIKLHGTDAREHPVYVELTRVKQYYEKLGEVESTDHQRSRASLDKEAAARFIKHDLAANKGR